MKKLIVAASLVLSLATFGAWEKIGVVQVADVNALVTGITKLGEFTGNSMIGLMMSSSVMKLPCVQLFGPGREGVPMAFSLLWDGTNAEYAVLYPIAQTQQEFLTKHPGKADKQGVIRLDPEEGAESDDARYVKFSPDGQWVAYSDKKSQLAPALKDIKIAARPMKGDLVKAVVGKNGMKIIRTVIEADDTLLKGDDGKRFADIMMDCESLACGASLDDKGLALRGKLTAMKDSELAKCGLKSLPAGVFDFAKKDSVSAYAIAADCGQTSVDLKKVLPILAKHGISTDFLAVEGESHNARMTLDLPAAIAYFKGETNLVNKLKSDALEADLKKIVGVGEPFKVENPLMAGTFAFKGFETTVTPAQRVKATLPEVAKKSPYLIQIGSLYAIVKAVIPLVVQAMDPNERAMFEPIVQTLPPMGKGGVGMAAWREKDAHGFLVRISADEFKSVSAGFSAFAAYQMQQQMMQPQTKPCPSKKSNACK